MLYPLGHDCAEGVTNAIIVDENEAIIATEKVGYNYSVAPTNCTIDGYSIDSSNGVKTDGMVNSKAVTFTCTANPTQDV